MQDTTAHPSDQVIRHDAAAFEAMRRAGRLAAETLDYIAPAIRPGITTGEIDRLCAEFMARHGAKAATLGYKGFPASCCTSANHVVCHGIPGDKVLKDGDIINVDVTPIVDGWHGDTSRMFYVGKPKVKAKKLVEITYQAMMAGIEMIRPGVTLGDLGHTIQTLAEGARYSVVRDFCGHGVGRVFHCPPSVLHYGFPGEGLVLEPGMIFTVEPMINAGVAETKILEDGWTAVTRDRSLSAQFEHTVGVTETGVEIFTLSPKGWHCPPYQDAAA